MSGEASYMSTCLHLHLGAHKTASTHFQQVMAANRCLYADTTHYVPMDEFRERVTRKSKFLGPQHRTEIRDYLSSFLQTRKKNIVISDENILGEANQLFKAMCLYGDVRKRLEKFRDLISAYEEITIWFSIRRMDEFIPSLYCEYLLHFPFRRFSHAFSGRYEQRWVPVVIAFQSVFPNAMINVIPYESYRQVLPEWLTAMTGVDFGWNLLPLERPRRSFHHWAVILLSVLHRLVPRGRVQDVLCFVSGYLFKWGFGGKFAPFGASVRERLISVYLKDIEELGKLGGGVRLLSRGSLD